MPRTKSQLFEAVQNHDAVISTLGPREVFKPSSLLNDSAIAASRAMQRSGVKRLVVLSAAAHFPGIPNRIASFILRNHMRDSLAMEKIVQANGLDWTIARPPRLTQEDSLNYRSREGAAPRMGFTLSRKAVAAFMLDAIEQKEAHSQNRRNREIAIEISHYTSPLLFWPRRSSCRQCRRRVDAELSGSYSYSLDGSPKTAPSARSGQISK